MDRLPRIPQAGNEAVRALLDLDVSYLRDGGFLSGALPSFEEPMRAGTGDGLCHRHFYSGVSDRELPEKEGDLPVELCGLPLSL